MTIAQIPNQRCTRKWRRSHHKSRHGCFECKRRRVKCDELRPSCSRCTLLLGKCSYLLEVKSTAHSQRDELSLPSPPYRTLSQSSNVSLQPKISPSFETSIYATAAYIHGNRCSITSNDRKGLTDADLYNHYLQHTSHNITVYEGDRYALQIEMPKLALQSKPVFHSLLAVSAACLCHDMISEETAPDTSTVRRVLMAGYQQFNLASERIREAISSPSSLTPESLLASAILLVPFATASQQINHWISSRSDTKGSCKIFATTPKDAIIIMRAIRKTLQALHYDSAILTRELSQELEISSYSLSPESTIPQTAALALSRTHVMLPILTATVQRAFSRLQHSIDSALLNCTEDPKVVLPACGATFEVLKYISNKVFPTSNISSISSLNQRFKGPFKPESVPLPQIAPWVRSFARRARSPLPTEPLTSFLLGFLVQAPQVYLDFVLPLLDRRLESPRSETSDDPTTEVTREETLALDIYAHWSVLMFLVEEDSWWIGNLPAVTLTGMVNRYGDDFATRLWPITAFRQETWWPGSMLSILREIKRHR